MKPAVNDHLSIKTTWSRPSSACTIDFDLCKETTSLLRPLSVVAIDRFHHNIRKVQLWLLLVSMSDSMLLLPEVCNFVHHNCQEIIKLYPIPFDLALLANSRLEKSSVCS